MEAKMREVGAKRSRALGARYRDAALILATAVRHGLRTVAFVKVRSLCELILQDARVRRPSQGPEALLACVLADPCFSPILNS